MDFSMDSERYTPIEVQILEKELLGRRIRSYFFPVALRLSIEHAATEQAGEKNF